MNTENDFLEWIEMHRALSILGDGTIHIRSYNSGKKTATIVFVMGKVMGLTSYLTYLIDHLNPLSGPSTNECIVKSAETYGADIFKEVTRQYTDATSSVEYFDLTNSLTKIILFPDIDFGVAS